MRKLSDRTLARLERYERYKGGKVKNWRDPVSGRVYSDWRVRTERKGGISPRVTARIKKAPGVESAQAKAESEVAQLGLTVDYTRIADAWARQHGISRAATLASPEFWNKGVRLTMLRWWQKKIKAPAVFKLFRVNDPRELFWYH